MDLFHTWRDHYIAKLQAELTEIRKRAAANDCKLAALIVERDRHSPTANQFVSKCGEIIADPLDREQMRIRQPHFIAASLPQVHEGLERWRDGRWGTKCKSSISRSGAIRRSGSIML